ncbi:hypothetical protein NC653_023237 [Populus alba x Populus x berolinensis]|uniref:Uncharacterized protein n=1 Tax=Populus alba x Populus x berolinensis TaxID=444605 RepID=A0AAD6MGY6_9ROSI|nr:hypothetical protein NC653_023237 [Populus alba x Populus x berolinensis]
MVHLWRMSSKAALYMPTHADRWRELERKRDERDQLLPTVQSITALGEVNNCAEALKNHTHAERDKTRRRKTEVNHHSSCRKQSVYKNLRESEGITQS